MIDQDPVAGQEPGFAAAAAEAFTAMKEAERRKNVEIITVDCEYDPTQQGGYADGYKPKVPTGIILSALLADIWHRHTE